MEYIRAFITGGIICILVQILMDHTTLQPGRIMVILVIAGVLLGALGIYKKIEEFGGCGATVPLSGFGFSLWKGMKEAIDKHGRRLYSSSCGNICCIDFFISCIIDLSTEDKKIKNREFFFEEFPVFYFFVNALCRN